MLFPRLSALIKKSFTSQKHLSIMSTKQKQSYLHNLQKNCKLSYKHYPYLSHQDPTSKQYVYSQLDQYHQKIAVTAYNAIIDDFKHDLKMQKQVWNAINNLDRPYKKGIPGIDTNLNPNGPSKPQLEDLGFQRYDQFHNYPFTFANEDRFIANTPYHQLFNFKNIQQWQQQLKARPVTRAFNAKGYKYDVPVKPEDKYQYLADRLGHPQYIGSPVQWLFRFQDDIYHPHYVDQPFIKTPSPTSHPSLNFQQGEVIYQNTHVMQWVKLLKTSIMTLGSFIVIFVPLNLVFRTNLITDAADQLFPSQYHLVSPTNIDLLKLSIPVSAGAGFYVVYMALNFPTVFLGDYIVKMSYSKDKQLIFVKRVDVYGTIIQQVHQLAHLQILPPSVRSGVGHLSSQDKDGLWRVTCMNTQRQFLMYNNPKYWNTNLKDEFVHKLLSLWDKSYYGFNREQAAENLRKWRQSAKQSLNQQALPKK